MKNLMILGLLLATAAGCKSDGDPEAGAELKTELAPTALPVLKLDAADEQQVYLKLLAAELNAGVKVAKDQLHAIKGLVECRTDGDLEACTGRVRLPEDALSGAQPLEESLGEKIYAFLKSARPELTAHVLADLNCDYLGKKSPPYGIEDVQCEIVLPRAPHEAVFDGKIAEELAELARGTSEFGKGTVAVSGALACHTVAASGRRVCTVRGTTGGVLAEGVAEVSTAHGSTVAKRLIQALVDQKILEAKKPGATPVAPKELMGSLSCTVDSTKLDAEGRRKYVCQAKP